VRYWWRSPQKVFFGAFEEYNNHALKLILVCAANHMQDETVKDIVGKGYSNC
jgi:hypothetical protein